MTAEEFFCRQVRNCLLFLALSVSLTLMLFAVHFMSRGIAIPVPWPAGLATGIALLKMFIRARVSFSRPLTDGFLGSAMVTLFVLYFVIPEIVIGCFAVITIHHYLVSAV